jgi:hypothetical protein
LLSFDSKFDICISAKSGHDLEKSWHDFDSEIRVCFGKNLGTKGRNRGTVLETFSIVLCTNVKLWYNLTWSEALFKHSLTYLLSKLGESHGNQRKEFLEYLDAKCSRSLGEVQSFKMWILENQKRSSWERVNVFRGEIHGVETGADLLRIAKNFKLVQCIWCNTKRIVLPNLPHVVHLFIL